MGKSNHFLGQPSFVQLIKSLDKAKITEFSLKHGGEKYVKKFNCFTHLLTMLYGVMMRFESLREIETAMTAEVNKLHHLEIESVPKRSTISDANSRRSEKIFEQIYSDLYDQNRTKLSSDSRWKDSLQWMGLATIVRIILMYYLNLESFLNDTESDLRRMIEKARE